MMIPFLHALRPSKFIRAVQRHSLPYLNLPCVDRTMFGPTPQRRSVKLQNLRIDDQSSDYQPTIELDCLIPSRDSTSPSSHYSTGNTPTSTFSQDPEDAYSPPMDIALLPGRPTPEGLKTLQYLIDLIPLEAASGGELTWRAL